ncbi:MAG: VCBS repeat-containing protein [Rhodothermales bacterium]
MDEIRAGGIRMGGMRTGAIRICVNGHRPGSARLLALPLLVLLACALLVLLACAMTASAQPARLPISAPYPVPALGDAALDLGDLEGDGDLDLVVAGTSERGRVIRGYRLVQVDGVNMYEQIPLSARPIIHGAVRWGDYDADGDGDLVVTGMGEAASGGVQSDVPVLEVYENTGAIGTTALFELRQALPGLHRSSAAWGDVDGDGDLDLVAAGLPSVDAVQPVTRLYRNDEGTFRPVESGLPGVHSGDLAWADVDGDGDLDLALMGDGGEGAFVTGVYRNDGGAFVDAGYNLPRLAFGSVDWADYDRDGDPDLLLSGGRLDPRFLLGIARVYRNDDGVLVETAYDLEGWTLGRARWGDADRDGDLDIFVVGTNAVLETPFLKLLVNDDGAFVPEWEFTGMRFASMAVADYNQDGDADVTLIGQLTSGVQFRFLINWDYPECVSAEWVPRGASTGVDCPPPDSPN